MSRRRPLRSSSDCLHFSGIDWEEPDGFTGPQFSQPPRKLPWKAISFILTIFVLGVTCLSFAILTSTGYFEQKYQDRAFPLLILGILMLIPGGYYSYILLCICLRRDGYSLDDVPLF